MKNIPNFGEDDTEDKITYLLKREINEVEKYAKYEKDKKYTYIFFSGLVIGSLITILSQCQ